MNNSWIVNKQNRLVYDNDMNTFRNHLDNCVEISCEFQIGSMSSLVKQNIYPKIILVPSNRLILKMLQYKSLLKAIKNIANLLHYLN